MYEGALNTPGLGFNTGLLNESSEKGIPFSRSGMFPNRLAVLLFLECIGLPVRMGFGGVMEERFEGPSLSLNGALDLLFPASFASLVLLNRTLPRLRAAPGLTGLLGAALDPALVSSVWYSVGGLCDPSDMVTNGRKSAYAPDYLAMLLSRPHDKESQTIQDCGERSYVN